MELKFSLFNRPKLYDFYTHYKNNFVVCKIEIYCEELFTRYQILEINKSDFENEDVFIEFLKKNDNLRIFSVYTAFGGVVIRCAF